MALAAAEASAEPGFLAICVGNFDPSSPAPVAAVNGHTAFVEIETAVMISWVKFDLEESC